MALIWETWVWIRPAACTYAIHSTFASKINKSCQNLHLVSSLFVCVHHVDQIHLVMWRKTQEGIELWKIAASAEDKDRSTSHSLKEWKVCGWVCVPARRQHEMASVYDNALNPHKGKRVGAEALPALWLMLSEDLSNRSLALIHWALVALWNVNGEASWFL